jgi:general secretion pathway protein D
MKSFLFRNLCILLAAVCLVPALAAQPAPVPPPRPVADAEATVGPIMLRDESIDQVLVLMERWTGRTILRPQAMPAAAITLTLRETITKAEAIQAVETLLNLNGIALTPLGTRFYKATPLSLAKSEAPEFIEGSTLDLTPSGRTASKLFQLTFLRIGEFMPQITGLLNPAAGSPPVVFEKANSALITDSVSNLQRIESLLAKLDQPMLAGLSPKFYPLHFAKASEVVNKIRTLVSGPLQSQIGTGTSFNADDRTNQVMLVSDPRQQPFFDELIAKLDVKSDPNTRNDLIFIKHARAKDVATILTQLVTGQNTAAKSSGADGSRPLTSANNPAAPQGPATAAPAAAPAGLAGLGLNLDSSNQFSSLLTILPDERSNSIVVSGTVDDVRLINELVNKIDVLLAQVRIEVVIAEVTLSDNASSGISALGLKLVDGKLVGFGATAAGATISDATFSAGTTDLSATIALSTTPRKSNAIILSQPTIITSHNKAGHIFVGESRPTISSYLNDNTGTSSGLGGYRSTVGQQKIGIDLTVTPLIGTDGSVELEIKQTVDDVLGEITIDGNPQPRIGNRMTESVVSVHSGEIIVLGGLQRTSKTRSTSRLGPIPFLGDLFGTRTRENTRTDLVFFLRPTVLTNTAEDNATALRQVDNFPKDQQEQVKAALKLEPKS